MMNVEEIKEIYSGQIAEAIREAMAPVVELQSIAVKFTLTANEVSRLYGISESLLEKLLAAGRGPAYIQAAHKGKVLYTRKAMEDWLARNTFQTQA